MTPELARALFPKSLAWQIKRAFMALLSYQDPMVVFCSTYHSILHEVLPSPPDEPLKEKKSCL